MKHALVRLLAIGCVLGPAARAEAQVNVGDRPRLQFRAVDGTPVSLDDLKGKLVLVDFWATWCGPCMAEAGHMVEINKKYRDRGLQFIGISLDADGQKLEEVVNASGFTWPQYFDGQGWQNRIAVDWGVKGIPATFLISPDGVVIWKGHPAQIDGALEDAFKKHPPRLMDEKTLAQAGAVLDKAEAALKAGDEAGALSLAAKLPAASRTDAKLAPRIEAVEKQLEELASKSFEEASKLADEKKYGEAAMKLRDIAGLKGLKIAARAEERLAELMRIPGAKSAIQAAEKAARTPAKPEGPDPRIAQSETALAAARKLQADKKDEQAYAAFKSVMTRFAGMAAATEAAEQVKTYEQDPEFVKRVAGTADDAKARSALNLARSYVSAGRVDLARQRYQQVIDQFPGTSLAAIAKKEMDALPK